MILIIGGAYQGKHDYVKQAFSVAEEEFISCSEEKPLDFSGRCLEHLERFALYCVKNGLDAVELFRSGKEAWNDMILICDDISCGVVPLSAESRAWREMTGRLCIYLSGEAAHVERIFCGLPLSLK